jgi:NAD-dependent SIR2 family protein deacetylase
MKFIDKLFGLVECYKCKKKFKKNKNTTCGFTNGKSFYICPDCSIIIIDKAFKGENPFEKEIK